MDEAGAIFRTRRVLPHSPQRAPGSRLLFVGFLVVAAIDPLAAEGNSLAHFLGTWRGTSTCVNRELAPACSDETIVYEIGRSETTNAALLKADKVVDGKRVPMGELEFTYSEKDGCWRSEFSTPRVRGVWCLVIEGSNMTGSLRLLPQNAEVRKVQAVRM